MSKPIQIYRFGLRSFYRVATAIKSASLAIPIPDGVRHSLRLRRLQREKRRIYGFYDKRRSDHNQYKNDEELIDAMYREEMMEIELADEEINVLNSRRLIEQAERYDLPIPRVQTRRRRLAGVTLWRFLDAKPKCTSCIEVGNSKGAKGTARALADETGVGNGACWCDWYPHGFNLCPS
jgi:hypothetical protein